MKAICMLLQNQYDVDMRVRRKAEALVAAGYTVDVLALRAVPGPRRYTLNGVNVHTVALGKKRGSLARYIFEYAAFFLWAFVRVASLTPRRRYAVVDVNTLPDFLVFAALPARWRGAKVVLDMHEITPEFYISKYSIAEDSWLVRLMTFLERISFRFADHVITIHEPIQDLLVGRGLCRATSSVVMNAVDEARFALPQPSASTAAGPSATGRFVMMYHGTVTRIYGLDVAIEAFGRVHHDMPGAELWILGEGPEKPVLERLAEQLGVDGKVKLLGYVPPADIPGWLAQCDVGVLPMRRDVFLEYSFPNKLSEYIVVGKTVLVPRLHAIRHYFSEDALAYFEPGDVADLAKQMRRLFGDAAERARLSARARVEYAPIGWSVMRERYRAVIDALAGPPLECPPPAGARNATAVQR